MRAQAFPQWLQPVSIPPGRPRVVHVLPPESTRGYEAGTVLLRGEALVTWLRAALTDWKGIPQIQAQLEEENFTVQGRRLTSSLLALHGSGALLLRVRDGVKQWRNAE
jgi:N-dimethylarginine dimethylaminohydrolase